MSSESKKAEAGGGDISTICFEFFIKVQSGEPRFHLELLICCKNSKSKPGSESEVSWKCQPFSA